MVMRLRLCSTNTHDSTCVNSVTTRGTVVFELTAIVKSCEHFNSLLFWDRVNVKVNGASVAQGIRDWLWDRWSMVQTPVGRVFFIPMPVLTGHWGLPRLLFSYCRDYLSGNKAAGA